MRNDIFSNLLDTMRSGIYYKNLINEPVPHQYLTMPILLFHTKFGSLYPAYTIVTPVFEQAENIENYFKAISLNASLPFDWIIIDDASNDGSAQKIIDLISRNTPLLAQEISVIRNAVPIFETACDNIGFSLARSEFIIEIQADIIIKNIDFDRILIKASMNRANPSSVSGRCCHPMKWATPDSADKINGNRQVYGLLGNDIDNPEVADHLLGKIFIGETVNRGPWLLRSSDLKANGYLDERNYYLDNSDHDWHLRLFINQGRVPIYSPILIKSPLSNGSTRKNRSGLNLDVYTLLRAGKLGSQIFNEFLENYIPYQECIEIAW